MKIVLADDHDLIRDGLRPVLAKLADDVEVLEAATLDEALEIAANQPEAPDILILDLNMPGMDRFAGITMAKERFPDTPVVVLSASINDQDIRSSLDHGAAGYIPKTHSRDSMLLALGLVLNGERYLPSIAIPRFEPLPGDSTSKYLSLEKAADLTQREAAIARLLVDGHSNKQIGNELGIEEVTVKAHLRRVYRKLGVASRTQAVRKILEEHRDLIS